MSKIWDTAGEGVRKDKPMLEVITEIRCKICNAIVCHNYLLKGAGLDIESRWYHCGACGCVFNLAQPDPVKVFTQEYRKQFEGLKEGENRYKHYIRCFAPWVEEKVYGRKFLDVGYCVDYIILEMRARGWLATGIDLIPNDKYLTSDFISHDFEDERFDFIMLNDFLQCVDEPMRALKKAYHLLNPCGILMIVTPNTDLIRLNKIQDWGHWDMSDSRQFFSEELLIRMIGKVTDKPGEYLKVIFKDNNISNRFPSWHTIQLLAQKMQVEE
jgi:SAM-dependent methyltransferase